MLPKHTPNTILNVNGCGNGKRFFAYGMRKTKLAGM